jgi:hypothetical protein
MTANKKRAAAFFLFLGFLLLLGGCQPRLTIVIPDQMYAFDSFDVSQIKVIENQGEDDERFMAFEAARLSEVDQGKLTRSGHQILTVSFDEAIIGTWVGEGITLQVIRSGNLIILGPENLE